jgi:hypothetical protein
MPRSMAHMAALEVGLPTTREQELTRGGIVYGPYGSRGFAHAWSPEGNLCANPQGPTFS